MKGKLFLIPSPLGGLDIEDIIPAGTLKVLNGISYFAVEELRSARRYLSSAGLRGKIDALILFELNEHSADQDIVSCLQPLKDGNDMGLISEAGLPAVADPGARLVELCHENGIEVVPLSGPSSIFLALMASGKNGQNFTFNGYLPIKVDIRRGKIKELERIALTKGQSQIFIETPYRNLSLLKELTETLNSTTKLTIACNLTMEGGFVKTMTIKQWKSEFPNINKKPAVFII